MTTPKPNRKGPFKKILTKGEDSLREFWASTVNEAKETKAAGQVLEKIIHKKEVTAEEKLAFKQQSFDIIKVVFIGIPLAFIPGATLIMIVLVRIGKRFNFEVLPSSFNTKK